MQILGLLAIFAVVAFGFAERGDAQLHLFDGHALIMVLGGCAAAVMVRSRTETAVRTIAFLRELVPGLRRFGRLTTQMEEERLQISTLWADGKRGRALEVADHSAFASSREVASLVLNRAGKAASAKRFTELRHNEINRWQPAIRNWEMLSKLGPSFGMVGTITGMIRMFRNMSAENLNIGAAMSLALMATLYGVAFGAGLAGPISHFLNDLLDERLGLLERCEQTVNDIVDGAK